MFPAMYVMAPGHVRCAASPRSSSGAPARAGRRAGLRHGASLRLNGAAPSAPAPEGHHRRDTPDPTRRACRQRTRGPRQQARLPGSRPGPPRRPAAGLLANATTVAGRNSPSGEPGGDAAARVTGPMTRRFAQVTGWPTPIQRLEPAVLPAVSPEEDAPIRTHVRRPTRPPLLYFAAVLAVRLVRISLLTSGAKRARTADL